MGRRNIGNRDVFGVDLLPMATLIVGFAHLVHWTTSPSGLPESVVELIGNQDDYQPPRDPGCSVRFH